ncbi:hypothetical protein PsorP6_002222 [Peronosclerospora sorghi]|uniref:Uncharacterized protein n=1 Tax=Peronosclerospora sorghi TaxID=230839 RepID=A0ACC0WV13_9STRA|nr:hypothetical protein PsorP6_002222 [Peronosclerospora sorghi]
MADSRRIALERWRDEKRRKGGKEMERTNKFDRSARRVIAHRGAVVRTQEIAKRRIFPSSTTSDAVSQLVSHSASLEPLVEGRELLYKTPAKARSDTDQTSATPASKESLQSFEVYSNRKRNRTERYISPSSNVPSLAGGAQRVLTPTRALLELDSDDDGGMEENNKESSLKNVPGPRRVSLLTGQIVGGDGVEPVTLFEAVKGETSQHVNSRQTIPLSSIPAKIRVSSSSLREANVIKNSAILESQELRPSPVTGEKEESQQPLAVQELSTSHEDTISYRESSLPEQASSDRFPLSSGQISTRTSLASRWSCESSSIRTSRADSKPKRSLIDCLNGNTEWEINDFLVTKNLGQGKFGNVYLAKVKGSNVSVALKVLSKSPLKRDGNAHNLKREIELQVRLRHPNVLNMHGYFHDSSCVYLVLEYAPHGELYKELARIKYFDDAAAAHYVAQVVEALKHCHSCGIIHRDIKPENLLLGYNNTIKLADFGWSVHAPRPYNFRNTFCGTPDYLSPEIVLGLPYDYRTDSWSLGVLAYELLIGVTPFYCANVLDMYKRIESVNYNFPPTPSISDNARNFIDQLLKKKPADRMELKDASQHPWILNRY